MQIVSYCNTDGFKDYYKHHAVVLTGFADIAF